jgi:hypothetical protein
LAVTTTQVFDCLDRHGICSIEKYEISSTDFGALRRSLRSIVLSLRDGDDIEMHEIVDKLRRLLSGWLTAPVPFDDTIFNDLATIGDPDTVKAKWGADIGTSYNAALRAAKNLPQNLNPVRLRLLDIIRALRAQNRMFRIYCHRTAAPDFKSIVDKAGEAPLENTSFLHSVKDYREAEPFDVLIKVGPLRSHGWGAVPDALLTAPRFTTLVQIVWSGCGDEPDFGYDPVAAPVRLAAGAGVRSDATGIAWTSRLTRSGRDMNGDHTYVLDEDEFEVFRTLHDTRDKRPATLIQIDEDHGIFYPPHSQVLSFDPAPGAQEPLARRLPGEALVDGMFIVQHILGNVQHGGPQAEHGHYSQRWKACLVEELHRDAQGLCSRLRQAGLDLIHLRAALANWCKPPTTVIHAPQLRKHFETLVHVLDVHFDASHVSGQQQAPGWQHAWNEIRHSRGEAIQAGVQEQGIIDEQLLAILHRLLPDIQRNAEKGEGFPFSIPAGEELKGFILFFKVCSVEGGFLVPHTALKCVCELDTVEQWRV